MVDPTTISTAFDQVDKSLGWLDKAIGYLKPYKPEAKFMRINFRDSTAEISLRLYIPNQAKRSLEKVVVPAYPGFQIMEFMDETFSKVDAAWFEDGGKWKFNPKLLPASEHYLLRLRGKMSPGAISRLVRIQPARNRDQTEELDRYWLDTMIRDVELVEKIWSQIRIDEVNLQVRVGVERPFSTAIPSEMSEKLGATQEWIRAGRSGDFHAVFNKWKKLRSSTRSTGVEPEDIVQAILSLTKPELFLKYLTIDQPYALGQVNKSEDLTSIFPRFMTVEAFTDLSLKSPTARGYLAFERKKFEDEVRKRFESL